MVKFIIPGPPVGKERARGTSSGYHYTPEKTVNYQYKVSLLAMDALEKIPEKMIEFCDVTWGAEKKKRALKGEQMKRPCTDYKAFWERWKRIMDQVDPWDGPVYSYIYAEFPIPKSWSKKKRAAALAGEIRPKKPDADNIEKIVWDSCNGIIYLDDGQICEWAGNKVYGENPRVEVEFQKASYTNIFDLADGYGRMCDKIPLIENIILYYRWIVEQLRITGHAPCLPERQKKRKMLEIPGTEREIDHQIAGLFVGPEAYSEIGEIK